MNFELWVTFEFGVSFWIMVDFWKMGEGGQADKHTNKHTHQNHDSAWPKGQAEWKSRIRETKNLSTNADSSTDTFFAAAAAEGAGKL